MRGPEAGAAAVTPVRGFDVCQRLAHLLHRFLGIETGHEVIKRLAVETLSRSFVYP